MKTVIRFIILAILVFLPFYLFSQDGNHEHSPDSLHAHEEEHIEIDGVFGVQTDFYFTNANSSNHIQAKRPKAVYRLNFSPTLRKGDWSLTSKVSMLSNQSNFYNLVRTIDGMNELCPFFHVRHPFGRKSKFFQYHLVQFLILHKNWNLIDCICIP